MSFDGTVCKAVVYELNKEFQGGKVDRIFQTEKDELLLQIRKGKNRGNLVISASANNPRIYLTNEKKKNPSSPPAFCMLLRKHLESSTIISFEQVEMDRIIKIKFLGTNELFDLEEKTLIVEIMGRHSNIILVQEKDQNILDSIKRVNQSISRVRQVLPGIQYTNDEIINKDNPLKESKEGFISKLNKTDETKIKDFILKTYMGISPLIVREIFYRGQIENRPIGNLSLHEKDRISHSFIEIMETLNNKEFCPTKVSNNHKIIAFSSIELTQYPKEDREVFSSIHTLLDHVYSIKDGHERMQQKSQNIYKSVKNQLDKILKKQEKLELELREAKDRKLFKVYGDVLSANSWAVKRGDAEITLENFYDNMNPITIPLDIRKDAIQNIGNFYKKYSKLKHAENTITEQLKKTRNHLRYLDSLLYHIENASNLEELDELKEEFNTDYLKKKSAKKKKTEKKHSFTIFHTKDKDTIYIGKNNRENSELTLKFAHSNDLWFHVKSGPGSHVILRSDNGIASESSILTAANLAAVYSRQKNSSNVEVDYTEKKHVKRHPSNQPGLVIYTDYKTLVLTPDISKVEELQSL